MRNKTLMEYGAGAITGQARHIESQIGGVLIRGPYFE